jgi:hypothetical protein
MRIGAILRRWIEILATLYLAWRESQREHRSLIVTRQNQHVFIRRAEPNRDAMLRDAQAGNILATLTLGTGVSADASRAVNNSFVVLEFPADKVVVRRISVPAQARKFLSGVIRNQIERCRPGRPMTSCMDSRPMRAQQMPRRSRYEFSWRRAAMSTRRGRIWPGSAYRSIGSWRATRIAKPPMRSRVR